MDENHFAKFGVEQFTYKRKGSDEIQTRFRLKRESTSFPIMLSAKEVEEAKAGYGLLPQGIKADYAPDDIFWLSVAATRNPDLLPGEPTIANYPENAQSTLEDCLKEGKAHPDTAKVHPDEYVIPSKTVVTRLDDARAAGIDGVKQLLRKKKANMDLRGALSQALISNTFYDVLCKYEGFFSNINEELPYKPMAPPSESGPAL